MTATTHFFIAIALEPHLKQKMKKWCDRTTPPFKRFVHEEDFHLTLAFIGRIEQSQLSLLKEKLAIVAKKFSAFRLTIDTLGYFGQKQSPRIFWAGVKEEEQLFLLQKIVANTCIEAGISLEKRSYHPHITIARKYIGETSYIEEPLKKSFELAMQNEAWEIRSFAIYQTNIEKVPKYEVISSFQLL